MHTTQLQELIKTLKSADIPKFKILVDQIRKNGQDGIINLKNYDKFRTELEKAYYEAISKTLKSMKDNFTASKEDVIILFKYSDSLGIFIDVSNIDVEGIISELHIDGLNKGIRSRIIELVRFFNEYNLFERSFTPEEINIIQDIKKNDKLLAVNLKDVFGTVSDSLIFYVCKVMPYDYVIWIRETLKNPHAHRFIMDPNSLRNWTDGYVIYDLVVRNLGKVEDFIKKVETKQKINENDEEMMLLEFNPRYIINTRENRIIRTFREKHIVYPKNILKNKEEILNEENYNFYSLSMVIFGGLGPEGFGFTYSTPRGEVIEICSDQKETEAIVIKFKQYLKEKFLDKFKKEMKSIGIGFDIRKKVINFLSDIINPRDFISYYNKNAILRKIQDFLLRIDEFQAMDQSKIDAIIEKISVAISIILRSVKLKDQFMARMDLVAKGKLKSEDVSKLTSLRGKSHYDVLRERMFLQNKPKWFFKNYPKEIKELEIVFRKLSRRIYERDIELDFDY
ncbi:MAG: hypothetical protein ACFFD7_05440 [Candidatus Thorarchaeota archaeon]